MSSPPTAASIIVPAYREAPNIEPLTTRVFAATTAAGIEAELIIVDDDSQDGTEAIVERLQGRYPIRLVVRRGERGLSGAVLAGFRQARFDRFVVMDADLQHPPELVPLLLARLDQGDCDFVLGTRYGGAGSIASDWPLARRLGSAIATLLARPLAPLTDPMSGFFALHRRTWEQAATLDPIGYKIALELFVKGGCRHPADVPITFASRTAGASKASFAEGRRYLRHLWRLYRFRFPRLIATLRVTFLIGAALFILFFACRPARLRDSAVCIPLKVAGVIVSRHSERSEESRSEAPRHVRRFFAALRMTSPGRFRHPKRDAPDSSTPRAAATRPCRRKPLS